MVQLVRELMVEPAVTVQADTTVSATAKMMRDSDIGDVIVVDAKKPIGMVTDRDIVIRAVAESSQPGNMTIGEICTNDLVSVRPEDDVHQASALMRRASVRRLPVVDRGELVGVLSLGEMAINRDEASALAEISAADPNS
ncbi:CBS domain-containing protein [Rugosimonospora acidiphila]|uniref:CBS domain-containing protein n=1 Tax=Rugosimonospora acidiphila TaxID=556531 RepID=A0ABP9RNT2_9ACTN